MVTIIDVNGAEMYAHTAWAESPDGDSFSTVEFDDADYIGTLIDRNAAEETDPTKYTWRYADAGMEEDEEDEEDEDVTADLSSDLEELADNVAEVADQINQQQVDFINTQNVTDGAIGNVNELNGTNDGVHGWTVPDGFRISQSYEDVDANPDTENVLVSTITRNTSGTDAAATFDATELVISLSGADAGNAYTLSLQSRMSELFEIPVSVSKSDGTNIMLDFGVINNAVTVGPEETEEEDAGIAEAAEEDPTVDEIIADEEGADETPTGEIAGAGAWSWFESTAETASVTADAQELRFDLAEMPVGAELSIANLKIEAGAMATPWRRSIKEVAGIAAEAQSTADEARRLVVDTIAAQEAHFQKLTADEAKIQSLEADSAEVKNLVAEKASVADLTAATGRIDYLETGKASVEQLEAAKAKIETLTAEKADINALKAAQANIDDLKTSKADIDFANVVVGNISEAWVRNLFIQGGFVSQSGTVYNLVGVRIDGDLINANTVKADKLLLQGDDGLYYAINVNALGETTASSDAKYQKGIDGSVIVAHSITADQITANNIVGTGGWINLAEGRFKYGNTGTGNFISWDGKSLEISLDKLNITSSSGISISVGERLADTLADVTVEYADSTSPTTAPTSGWSTSAPAWQEGHYTWSRTTSTNIDGTTKTSDPVCITGNAGGQGPPGADGKDAILLQIDSANGTQFKNTAINTVLTVTIRYGDKTITKSSQLYEAFGSSAYLTWSEKKIGETEFTPLAQGDSRIGDNGFYLTIGADDVNEKSVFECELNF